MASAVQSSPSMHHPVSPHPSRPKGILKNSYQDSHHDSHQDSHRDSRRDFEQVSPLTPPRRERSLSSKEITIINTHANAGHHREPSSAGSRTPGSRRQSARDGSVFADDEDEPESSQRLKWDEANLYLTEQERTSTMKITEPKTPYAKHYDPDEDPSSEDEASADKPSRDAGDRHGHEDDIPGLSLGEPEEAVPEFHEMLGSNKKEKAVHVDDVGSLHDSDGDMVGWTAEEKEKHRRFEALRRKHYEMKDVAKLLGHAEGLPEDEDDEDDQPPSIPPMPPMPLMSNGSTAQEG